MSYLDMVSLCCHYQQQLNNSSSSYIANIHTCIIHTYKLHMISMMHLSISHYLSLSSTNPRLSMYYSAEGESGTAVRTDRTIDDYLGWQEDGQDRFRCGVAQQGPAVRVRLLAVLAEYR